MIKYQISDVKLVRDRGICFICSECVSPLTSFIKEHSAFKNCDVAGCENATDKTFDLSHQYNVLIKEKPEKNPDLRIAHIEKLVQEGLLFKSNNKLFATYNFINRYQDILDEIKFQNDELYLIHDIYSERVDLTVFKNNKIGIEVSFYNPEDLSSARFQGEIKSKENTEFDLDEILLLANSFRYGFRDFYLTKTQFNVCFE
jgi:hypothetical protein